MENATAEVSSVPENLDQNIAKQENGSSSHALGLQDLYKAAFIQEVVPHFRDNTTIASTNIIDQGDVKYFNEDNNQKIDNHLGKADEIFKGPTFDEPYHLYSLKGLEYSVDFVKQENSLDLSPLNFEESKVQEVQPEPPEQGLANALLTRSFETFRTDSVLDLDKGIEIHLVKADGTPVESVPSTDTTSFNYGNCEYTGDAQILHRYLCDSANVLCDSGAISVSEQPETPALEFTARKPNGIITNNNNNNNSNTPGKLLFENDTIGVNPETLGVRFEDCDFNSSDSFASTESIIPKNIKCPKCPKKFMFKSDLLRHDKYKHSVRPKLFCKYCNKEFVSQQNLLFHEKSHKKKRGCSYKCEICKKVFKKSAILVRHTLQKHSKFTHLTCAQCGKTFSSQVQLNSHFRKCHSSDSEKPYKCDICSKTFEKKQGLSCHAKAHLDEHLFVCQYCNKAFSKVCYLKNHLKSHHEEKDIFVCDTCGKDFKTSSALEDHSRKHTGEKPFTCNVCMKSFAYKACFKVHIKKHGHPKTHQCTYCQSSFATSSDLNNHEKAVHGQEMPLMIVKSYDALHVAQGTQMSQWKDKSNSSAPSQEVCTQTIDFVDAANLQNLTFQNVNLIVDQSTFANQQPILLTSLGSLINSVPVILTQNPIGPYSVSSIT